MNNLNDSLQQLLLIPTDPGQRLYWLFILSALLLASITVSLQQRRFNLRAQLAALFNRHYWFNRSTATDAGLLLLNGVLRVLILLPLLGSHLAGTIAVSGWLQHQFGDAPVLQLSGLSIAILYTLVFFLLEDLSRFALHRGMHRLPLLWYFHRSHHSASVLTPLTVHRVHPVEMALYQVRGLLVFSLVSGSFVYLFRDRVSGIDILGVDCLGFMFNALGANLRHSPIFLSFGRFEKCFISPAQHQLHHSKAPEHRDINFGTCLAIWDRLFGSWHVAGKPRALEFGLNVDSPTASTSTKNRGRQSTITTTPVSRHEKTGRPEQAPVL